MRLKYYFQDDHPVEFDQKFHMFSVHLLLGVSNSLEDSLIPSSTTPPTRIEVTLSLVLGVGTELVDVVKSISR